VLTRRLAAFKMYSPSAANSQSSHTKELKIYLLSLVLSLRERETDGTRGLSNRAG